MSNFYADPYNRLSKYYELFLQNEFEASEALENEELRGFLLNISILSERLGIPKSIIEMDLVDLLQTTDDDFLMVRSSDSDDEYLERNEEVYAKIRAGEFDEAIIVLNLPEIFGSIIKLDKEEVAALNKADEYMTFHSIKENPVLLKDIAHLIPPGIEINDKLDLIKSAIADTKEVTFAYLDEEDERSVIKCIPLKLVFDDKYKILIVEDAVPKVLDVERICSEIIILGEEGKKPDSILLSVLPQMWGFDFETTPYMVKVKFYNDPGVFDKVREDLSNRTMGSLIEKNNALYYEDTVYGLEAFKDWIYSYGNSAVVIKPVVLRNEILKNMKKVVAMK